MLVIEATVKREFATISGYSLYESRAFIGPEMLGDRATPFVSIHIDSHAPFVAVEFYD